MRIKKDDLPQFKFSKIILQKENPTLLNYGTLDLGFYTASGIVPTNKYFIKIHVPLKEMDDEQNRILEEGLVDFVVSKERLKAKRYFLVSDATLDIRKRHYEFYLYERDDLKK